MLLFGSRARGDNRPESDIDVFIESEEEIGVIPSEMLVWNGGLIDPFWAVDGHGQWTEPAHLTLEEQERLDDWRMLLVDKSTLDEVRSITALEVIAMAKARPIVITCECGAELVHPGHVFECPHCDTAYF